MDQKKLEELMEAVRNANGNADSYDDDTVVSTCTLEQMAQHYVEVLPHSTIEIRDNSLVMYTYIAVQHSGYPYAVAHKYLVYYNFQEEEELIDVLNRFFEEVANKAEAKGRQETVSAAMQALANLSDFDND